MNLKRDYEDLLKQVKDEYAQCTTEMKSFLDNKTLENGQLSAQMKELQDKHRKERCELEDALHKDKYTTELFTMENERLKLAKQDFDKERD